MKFVRIALVGLVFTTLLFGSRTASATILVQQTPGSLRTGSTLTVTLPTNVVATDLVVVAVAYANRGNTGNIAVSGLGATWTQAYVPPMQNGIGLEFIIGENLGSGFNSVTITVPRSDSLAVNVEDWEGLSAVQDSAGPALAWGTGTTPAININANSSNEVVLTALAYTGAAYSSPSQVDFRSMLNPQNTYSPHIVGGYRLLGASGSNTNNYILSAAEPWISAAITLQATDAYVAPFAATPLTDFAPGELYLGKFSGLLYDGSNTTPVPHDADGRAFGAAVQPLDASGNPSASGKIAVVGIGPSNWTEELCSASVLTRCDPNTFFDQASKYPGINPNMVLVNCANGGAFAVDWTDPNSTRWNNCFSRLTSPYGVTPQQVEVVMWMDADENPKYTLAGLAGLKTTTCPANPTAATAPDACIYEQYIAQVARLVKIKFPNIKQMFLQARTYGGNSADKEPYAYETGFSTKWIIRAQINQLAGLGTDPLAGDLSYSAAPWMNWAAYTWASGTTPRQDGFSWLGGDFAWDGNHTSQCLFYGISCGRKKTADMMMAFYTTSPYTPWFLNGQ